MCSRGTPLDELPDVSMRNCSLDVDLTEIQHLPDVLKAVSDEQRLQMRVWSCTHAASPSGKFSPMHYSLFLAHIVTIE